MEERIKNCLNCELGEFPDSEWFGYCPVKKNKVITITSTPCKKFVYDAFGASIYNTDHLQLITKLWNEKSPKLGIQFNDLSSE